MDIFLSSLNLNFGAGKVKRVLSEATKRKISRAKKGIPCSEAAKQKISQKLKGKPKSEAHKQKLSEAAKEFRRQNPEFTEMHREAQNILWSSPEGTEVREAMKAQYLTQSDSVKQVVRKKRRHEKLTPTEEGINTGAWAGFWEDNQSVKPIYQSASANAYARVDKYKANSDK